MEKVQRIQQRTTHVVCEFGKAYDIILRELIWDCLRKRRVPEAYIDIIKNIYQDCTIQAVTSSGETEEEIKIYVKLHRRSALSPLMFIIIMDVILEDGREGTPWSIHFPDNLVLCDERREDIEEQFEQWRQRLEDMGLKVSRGRTEYLPPFTRTDNIRLKKYNSTNYANLPQCTSGYQTKPGEISKG